MSLAFKVLEVIAKVMPDRSQDALIGERRLIGKPIERLDGPQKTTGAAKYAAEYPFENLAHAALVFSTVAKGRIEAIDVERAERMPGVLVVLTHRNAPRMEDPPVVDPMGGKYWASASTNVLNTEHILWDGQPVALVVADTLERAEFAASLITVRYQEEPAQTSLEQAKTTARKPKNVLGEDTEIKRGVAEQVLRSAKYRVDARFETPHLKQCALEPHAATAVWKDGKLTVYDSSQYVAGAVVTLAKIFRVEPKDIRVLCPFVGGAFGSKVTVWSSTHLCVLAAKVVNRPVRLALSREGVHRIVGGRTPTEQRVALSADKTGRFTSLVHTGVATQSFTNQWPEQFTFPARVLYAAESLLIRQEITELNQAATSSMRAPGEAVGSFALESAVDELSWQLGMDPIDLRLRNEPECDPVKGTRFSSRHLREAYALGAERFGWASRSRPMRSQRDGDWLVGQGMAAAYYPAHRMPASARVRIRADGTALVQTAAHEMGMGTSTVQTQHAAARFGLPMEKVRFEYGDTDLPPGSPAGGSAQTLSLILAVEQAFDKVRKELLALARKEKDSPLANARLENTIARDGGLFRADAPQTGETYQTILSRAGREFCEAEVKTGLPFESFKYAIHSYGAQFCEVRVHGQTGEVRISRWVAAFDTGRILNPQTAVSQFRGGIIMGIGMALMEETHFDERNGRIMNPSLAEYHVPVNADVPRIDVYYTDIADPHTPLGAHGVGEIGITGVAAAIANAVFHATGKRVRSLPITLDKFL